MRFPRIAASVVVTALVLLAACKSVSTTTVNGRKTYTFNEHSLADVVDEMKDREFTKLATLDVTVIDDRVLPEITIAPIDGADDFLAQVEEQVDCEVVRQDGAVTITLK